MNKLKANLPLIIIGILLTLLTLLFTASLIVSNKASPSSETECITSPTEVVGYLGRLGWETQKEPSNTKTVTIPKEFDKTYDDYNLIQKSAGFDLEPYRSKIATMYTFKLLNHIGGDKVFVNVLVCDGKVIGGDIISYALDGFIDGLTANPKSGI